MGTDLDRSERVFGLSGPVKGPKEERLLKVHLKGSVGVFSSSVEHGMYHSCTCGT